MEGKLTVENLFKKIEESKFKAFQAMVETLKENGFELTEPFSENSYWFEKKFREGVTEVVYLSLPSFSVDGLIRLDSNMYILQKEEISEIQIAYNIVKSYEKKFKLALEECENVKN